jgi:hypothetical protein
MAQATDWQNVATDLRDTVADMADAETGLREAKNFYDKNQDDAYFTGLADADLVGDSGLTKAEFVSAMTLYEQLLAFLDNGAPAQGDYRATVEQTRATR